MVICRAEARFNVWVGEPDEAVSVSLTVTEYAAPLDTAALACTVGAACVVMLLFLITGGVFCGRAGDLPPPRAGGAPPVPVISAFHCVSPQVALLVGLPADWV